jgi:hypothetical protein
MTVGIFVDDSGRRSAWVGVLLRLVGAALVIALAAAVLSLLGGVSLPGLSERVALPSNEPAHAGRLERPDRLLVASNRTPPPVPSSTSAPRASRTASSSAPTRPGVRRSSAVRATPHPSTTTSSAPTPTTTHGRPTTLPTPTRSPSRTPHSHPTRQVVA